jgi:hypothetical protein
MEQIWHKPRTSVIGRTATFNLRRDHSQWSAQAFIEYRMASWIRSNRRNSVDGVGAIGALAHGGNRNDYCASRCRLVT